MPLLRIRVQLPFDGDVTPRCPSVMEFQQPGLLQPVLNTLGEHLGFEDRRRAKDAELKAAGRV